MKRRCHPKSHNSQGGVALIVALVVLVIIGLTSAAVMRGALNSDLVTNNTRVQSLANQAAQVGLKYCEAMWNAGALPPFNVIPVGDTGWDIFTNWSDASKVNDVPVDYMQSAQSSFVPDKLPQCMAQRSTVGAPPAPILVITSRGFSPDYKEDDGRTERGSVVWLQYILAI